MRRTTTLEKTTATKLRALIIEDEKHGLEALTGILAEHCPQLEVVATLSSVAEGLAFFESGVKIDLAFFDIHLRNETIFQLIDQLKEIDFNIIFTTAHDQYAVDAFRYSALDYLLKPIDPERLSLTINKLNKVPRPQKAVESQLEVFGQYYKNPNAFEKFTINGMDGMHFVNLRDIVRCQGNDNYTTFYLRDKTKVVVAKTLSDYQGPLERAHFYRVHKSHLINLNYMTMFSGTHIKMDDGRDTVVPVSRRRKKAFLEKIKALNQQLTERSARM
ncbi:MAG: LytTR family DNA-binding domain-containing protein [Bacteroidota bacterium]